MCVVVSALKLCLGTSCFCQILRDDASLRAIWGELLESQMKNALKRLGKFAQPNVPSRARSSRYRRALAGADARNTRQF